MEHQYGLLTRFNGTRDRKPGWQFTECDSLSDLRNCARRDRMKWRYPCMVAVRSDGATLTLESGYEDSVWQQWKEDAIAALSSM